MDENEERLTEKKRSPFGDILLASLWGDTAAAAIGLVDYLSGHGADYGWGVFAFLPFVAGFISGSYLKARHRTVSHVLLASVLSLSLASIVLLCAEWEGAVCIAMAFPLAVAAHFLASLIGGAIYASRKGGTLSVSFLVLAPFIYAGETYLPHEPSYHAVTTTIVVDAPPEKIWPYLVNLPQITPSNNLLFKAGIARPMSTHTNGQGVGAPRFCELSTGEMPEKISTWLPGKLLVFDMISTPPCMKEMNPFGPVHPAHLTGYFVCLQGRFELRPLGPNKTEIVGTSTFYHRLGPSWYWSLWTVYIVHSVHSSVLEEIKRRAEMDSRSTPKNFQS